MTLTFGFSQEDGNAVRNYIDLSQSASLVSRRFYRQGLDWAVQSIRIYCNKSAFVRIEKIPSSWVAYAAWKKAMTNWLRQQNEALDQSGDVTQAAKFRDFKIYADVQHVTAGFGANLLPGTHSGSFLTGEWQPSQIVIPNAGAPGVNDERYLHMVGINFNNPGSSRGIIAGYESSRNYPQSPDPANPSLGSTNNWFAQMFDSGDNVTDVLVNATANNDELPYDQDNYPGGDGNAGELEYHDMVSIFSSSGTDNIGVQTAKGGSFPCGLIAINAGAGQAADYIVQVNLMPGNHRGYLARKMQDV